MHLDTSTYDGNCYSHCNVLEYKCHICLPCSFQYMYIFHFHHSWHDHVHHELSHEGYSDMLDEGKEQI